jgi:hypothetical protein
MSLWLIGFKKCKICQHPSLTNFLHSKFYQSQRFGCFKVLWVNRELCTEWSGKTHLQICHSLMRKKFSQNM